MGGVASFKPFTIIITIMLIVAEANNDDTTKETPPSIPRPESDDDDNGGIATTSPTVSSSHSRHLHHGKKTEPLKPSTVIVVCVLTTLFSITFILLLYIKHCIAAGNTLITLSNRNTQSYSEERNNSGVDRAVVESLPVFRFGSLRGQKEGLDCAVCLARFEDSEVLRLLPKCNHAFHVECVDTWLHAHSTCPLCRHNIDPADDIITVVDRHNEALDIIIQRETNTTSQPGLRVSGRHSSEDEFLRNTETPSSSFRMEHRIKSGVHHQRWSNVEPSDLLYLTSEMIISEQQQQYQSIMRLPLQWNAREGGRRRSSVRNRNVDDEMEKGGMVNLRSVSEATGMSRFLRNRGREGDEQRHEGAVTRWLAWISVMVRPR